MRHCAQRIAIWLLFFPFFSFLFSHSQCRPPKQRQHNQRGDCGCSTEEEEDEEEEEEEEDAEEKTSAPGLSSFTEEGMQLRQSPSCQDHMVPARRGFFNVRIPLPQWAYVFRLMRRTIGPVLMFPVISEYSFASCACLPGFYLRIHSFCRPSLQFNFIFPQMSPVLNGGMCIK